MTTREAGIRCRALVCVLGSLAGLLLVTPGCHKPKRSMTDSSQARSSVQAALDVWRDGGTADSLKGRSPPIVINDPQWKDGVKLISYEFKSEGTIGFSWRCGVNLTLQSADGSRIQQAVTYVVDIGKAVVIVRDFVNME